MAQTTSNFWRSSLLLSSIPYVRIKMVDVLQGCETLKSAVFCNNFTNFCSLSGQIYLVTKQRSTELALCQNDNWAI